MALEVGTDLYGQKHNILIQCAHAPSLYEFKQVVEAQFDVKARSSRPAGYPDEPFKVETMQVFGNRGLWEDLVHDQQLTPGCQVWVFQPESVWHSDAQGVIPGAKKSESWVPKQGSPSRTRGDGNTGVPPTLVEKMTSTFHSIDGNGKGYLLPADVDAAFHHAGMQFTEHQGAFNLADGNRSGHITWDEWQKFAIEHQSVIDALFFRMRDAGAPLQYTAPPPQQYVSRQPEYPGQAAPYNPVPAQTYSQPPADYSGYQYQPSPAPQQSYSQPAPQQQYSQPAPQQQYSQPAPQGKSYEQEVAEFMDQTSPQRLAQGSPSRMPSQEYMNKAQAQTGARAPGEGSPQRDAPAQQYSQPAAQPQYSSPANYGYAAPPAQGYTVTPAPSYGAVGQGYQSYGSPQRQQAQSDYEAARGRADQARMAKEVAEGDERRAWDTLYQTPQ